jgi:hypothetical protein
MIVVLIGIDLLPLFIPVEELDGLVVGATQEVGQSRVYCQVSDEVCVLIDHFELLARIVVIDSNFGIVSTHNNPLFSGYKFSASHWSIGNLE